MTGFTLDQVDVTFSGRPVLRGVRGEIRPANVTTVIGPNGSGKSTLLRALARIVRPSAGRVVLDGQSAWDIAPKAYARRVSFLAQNPVTPEGLRVRALVERGRTPYLGPFRPMTDADRAAVEDALAATGLADLAERRVDRLSGGQRQRVWIAMALAQQTPVLLLDEPTSFLDLPHQAEVMQLVRKLNQDLGKTIVMVLHDINLAAAHSDEIVAMRAGRIVRSGPPKEIVTEELLSALFDAPLSLHPRGAADVPFVLP
ncbi:MAG: ABC transporter ATP-binding protein [Pseudomonadota bacterium]